MKLTVKEIKQLIKEELNKLLKESYPDEPKIPDAAPEGSPETYSEFETQEEIENCNKYYKNEYDKYTKQLNKIERFSGLKAMVGMSRQQEIKELKFKIDGLIYWSARLWGCMWAIDLLKKWPDQKFQKFIKYIQSREKPFGYIQDGYGKQDYSFTQDFWTLPQAQHEQRIEDETVAKEMGDEEMGIQEKVSSLAESFQERMTKDPNWKNEFKQYYQLLKDRSFEELFFALEGDEIGHEIFSYMLVSMGEELSLRLWKMSASERRRGTDILEDFPTLYKLYQGLRISIIKNRGRG